MTRNKGDILQDSKPIKVALYARVSTYDKGQDPETQLLKLRGVAKARGYEIACEHSEHASGANPRRPALDKVLAAARRNEFDAILITKLDRMMRSTANMLHVIEQLNGYGVGLICADQDIDTKSPTGRLLLILLAAIAEFERDLTVSRVNDGIARARAEGKHIGHPKGVKNTNKRGSLSKNGVPVVPATRTKKVKNAEDKTGGLS
jgi:DNA invertase Pin-like site-specific DNA recombinase